MFASATPVPVEVICIIGFPLEISFEEIEQIILPQLKYKELNSGFYNKKEIIKEFNQEFQKHIKKRI